MLVNKSILTLLAGLSLLSASLSFADIVVPEPKALSALKHQEIVDSEIDEQASQARNLRNKSIAETARALGVQTGVNWRHAQILKSIEKNIGYKKLDRIFCFDSLTLDDGKIIPPVISAVAEEMRMKSRVEARRIGMMYRIDKPAALITAAPNWRDYIFHDSTIIDKIHPSLLPKTKNEQQIWVESVEIGWRIGIRQADHLFDTGLNELVRDIRGMLKFKELAIQNIVSLPRLATGYVAIQVGNNVLDLEQKTFRITNDSQFNGEVGKWNPYPNTKTNR